jgi:hypothetical protein
MIKCRPCVSILHACSQKPVSSAMDAIQANGGPSRVTLAFFERYPYGLELLSGYSHGLQLKATNRHKTKH